MVYVINKNGQPLMPTNRHGKVKHLLKEGKAKVIKRCPFTIQLAYETKEYKQDCILNVDSGSKTAAFSVKTDKKELYSSEVEMRTDIVNLLSIRRESRRTRRNRKTRYRAPRFNNRRASKKEGWIAPSVKNKIDIHKSEIEFIKSILPITQINIETASFDIQKIKNPDIEGKEYQEGEQLGFWNVREYVLFRDNHTCQCCKGKSGDKILNVHHKESRKTGGNSTDNLTTLCDTCHNGFHKGKIQLPPELLKRGSSFRDATFMGIMKNYLLGEIRNKYPSLEVNNCYGYITKNNRIKNNLPKLHRVDAFCVAGNMDVEPIDTYYYKRKRRRHNRQIHKLNPSKGGIRKLNQALYEVKGFCLFDKVLYKGEECFISGRRASGYFKLIKLDGTVIHNSAKASDLTLLERGETFFTEQRKNKY